MSDVTTIIRIHHKDCLAYLESALFSVVGQQVEVDVIIVTQRFDADLTKLVVDKSNEYVFGAVKKIVVVNAECADQDDLRSIMLNKAFLLAQTRYAHILDFDDVMYPDAYKALIKSLQKTSAAISFGAIISTYYEEINGHRFVISKKSNFFGRHKFDLFVDNFCPIHSFMIDLSRVEISDIHFEESMSALEDYSFLIGFLAKYESDFSMIDVPVGEYYRRSNDSITSANTDYPDPTLRVSRLERAREHILQKKRSTSVSVRVSEFSWLLDNNRAQHNDYTCSDEKELRSTKLSQLFGKVASLLYNKIEALAVDAGDLDGFIDSIEVKSDGTLVQGWVNNFEAKYYNSYVLVCTRKGDFVAEADRFTREDVNANYGTTGFSYGFSTLIPTCASNLDMNSVTAFLVLENGEGAYVIKPH